jgi:hypothetical protein
VDRGEEKTHEAKNSINPLRHAPAFAVRRGAGEEKVFWIGCSPATVHLNAASN